MIISNKSTTTLNGAQIIIKALNSLGVDTIFGYPGGVVLDIYDELYKQKEIKHILVRHEQAAVHAAEGYAKVTGKCGIVLVTSGPGATNTITGIVNAYLDETPLVVLTGQVSGNLLGKNAFQEANISEITKSCTKKTYSVTSASDIQSTLASAIELALTGRKGPVVIDLVRDIFSQEAQFNTEVYNNITSNTNANNCTNYLNAINLIKNSKMPVILAGGGVIHANASNELLKLVEKTRIPVVSTMMGLGSIDKDNINYLGMVGIFGDKCANQLLKKADLIISLGARFNDRITCMFCDQDLSNKILQIDIEKSEIGNFITPIDSVLSDIKSFLNILIKECNISYETWNSQAQTLKLFNTKRIKTNNCLHTFEVMEEIEKYTSEKHITFTTEVGQHQLWAAQNLKFNKTRKLLTSGGAGTMGFGLPASIGASIAEPDTPVVCIAGDGSFQMSLQELATCVDYNLNIKIMLINNGYLGMVRQLQEKKCDARYSQTKISNPDYLKLAESYNIESARITNKEDIAKALMKAFAKNGPYLIEYIVEPMELL